MGFAKGGACEVSRGFSIFFVTSEMWNVGDERNIPTDRLRGMTTV